MAVLFVASASEGSSDCALAMWNRSECSSRGLVRVFTNGSGGDEMTMVFCQISSLLACGAKRMRNLEAGPANVAAVDPVGLRTGAVFGSKMMIYQRYSI